MFNGNEFGSPEWRSPLTGRNSEEILEQRALTTRYHAIVNVAIRAFHAENERVRQELLEAERIAAELEERERENG